jgi:predicted phage terminase large subunit-like protein
VTSAAAAHIHGLLRVERLRTDLDALAGVIGLPPLPPHAKEFARIIRENQASGHPVLVLAAVGHLKSTTLGLLQLQDLLGPDPHILFGSRSSAVVASTGNFLRAALKKIYPFEIDERLNDEGFLWNSTAFMVPSWRSSTKFPSWFGAQLGTAIEGMRGNRGYLDDPIDRNSQTSEVYRGQALTWFNNTYAARLNKSAPLAVIGSPWHPNDLYMNLIGRAFVTHIFPMVKTARPDLFGQYRTATYHGEDYEWLWPEQWAGTDIEKLIQLVGGRIPFQQRYLCNPQAILGSRFKPHWFKFWDSIPPEVMTRSVMRMGLDPATGKKDTGCLTALISVLWDEESGKIYVMDTVGQFLDPAETKKAAVDLYERYKHERILIEDVNYQVDLVQQLQRLNLPVFGQGTESRDKIARIDTLAVPIEQGRILFHKTQQDLIDELLYFPDGKYNDMADALEIAVREVIRHEPGDKAGVGIGPVSKDYKSWRDDSVGRDSEWRLEGPKTDGDAWGG